MRVHVVEVGRLWFPEGWLRSRNVLQILQSVLRGLKGAADTIPILAYVVEHDEGHIIIDTGASHAFVKRLLATPGVRGRFGASIKPDDEVGPKMRASGCDRKMSGSLYRRIWTLITRAGSVIFPTPMC